MPYIAVRGLRVVTEKAYGSPFSDRGEQMLNVWGFLGGTPQAMKSKTSEEIAEIHKRETEAREQKKIDEEKAREDATAAKKAKKEAKKAAKAAKKKAEKAAKAAAKKTAKEAGGEAKGGDDEGDEGEGNEEVKEEVEGTAEREDDDEEEEEPNRAKYEEQLRKSKGLPFKLKCNAILIQDVDLFVADLLSEILGGPPLENSRPAHINFILDKTDLGKDGLAKAFMLQKLINLAWKKAELMSIVNDLAMQVAQAGQNRINPLAIVGVINSLTGGMIYDAEDD